MKRDKKTIEKADESTSIRRWPSVVKRAVLFAMLIAAALLMMLIRGQLLVVPTYPVPIHTGKMASGRFRIAVLTDLHGRMIGENQEIIVSRVQEIRPDLIVCLGDMADSARAKESKTALAVLAEQLTDIAPVCYVDGNHEQEIRNSDPETYAQLNAELEKAGAVHLENEIVHFMTNGEDIWTEDAPPEDVPPEDRHPEDNRPEEKHSEDIPNEDNRYEGARSEADAAGGALGKGKSASDGKGTVVNLCGITTHYYWGGEEYALVDELREMDGINILLCHYPESVLWYDAFEGGGLDAALCGHTHGGLIRLPLVGGVYSPEQGWWPGYDQGAYPVYTDTDKRNYGGGEGSEYLGTMIISGGLAGEHGVPRINNPMEISLVEFSGSNP